MPKVQVIDTDNKPKGEMDLPEEFFGLKRKQGLMHDSVLNYLANRRQGTHATKTKGLVSGGGKKPYKQKGTGRARAGSIRSPLWRGGGTMFGPQPRDYYYSMPRQARKAALYAALSAKIADGEMTVVDSLGVEEPKTRKMAEMLEGLGLSGRSLLMVVSEPDRALALSARNIPGVSLMRARDLHAYDVLSRGRVLITREALEALREQAGR